TYLLDLFNTISTTSDMMLIQDSAFALNLGLMFGYERSYRGRAAGMRTYGIVCMVAAVLTSSTVHFGSDYVEEFLHKGLFIDPTRTIQGIVTGIGFLGAGIIMKDGQKISGLTTSASVWASAAIGVLIGLDYYIAAFVVVAMTELVMLILRRIDHILPSQEPLFISLQFNKDLSPKAAKVREIAREYGYDLSKNSVSIQSQNGQIEWRFVAKRINLKKHIPITELADTLSKIEGLESFHISRARN
ncbi:MAG: MgtC/SapB family protein, partial [Bdellovibrionales bacterium]